MTRSSMLPVADHQARVRALLTDRARQPVEIALGHAAGRVLAASVLSPEPLPAFDNSAMDGYAVRAAEIAEASTARPVRLPVAGDIPAGAPRGTLAPGTTLRIMTGAPVPEGADAVVEVEETDAGTEVVSICAAREVGSFVRPAGSDIATGQEVLAAGTVLGPAQIGVLAALGVSTVTVRRRPRVLVISTGSELATDPEAGGGQIRDANGVMLGVAIEEAGGEAVRQRWVADDVPAFLGLLDGELAATEVDLVITSGGVSAGAYEVVKDGLGSRGVDFVKVAMQPGMPQGAGRYGDVPVVCLPGNPVSALVSFEVFVRPALCAAAGRTRVERPLLQAHLSEGLTSIAGKRQLRRGRFDDITGLVQPWGPPGSGFLGWFAGANCLIDLAPETVVVAEGEPVTVWDLTS